MTRSRLRNKYLKNPNNPNKLKYNKQRNYCVNLLRKEKKKYYNNLDVKLITDKLLNLCFLTNMICIKRLL